jgi:hypothetical protein
VGQILVGLMAIFAMASSPINACACYHHEAREVESAAHENSCGYESATPDQPDTDSANPDHCKSGAECTCVRSTQKTASKSETAKINIHAAALLPSDQRIEVVNQSYSPLPLITAVSTFYRGHIDHSRYTRGPPVS